MFQIMQFYLGSILLSETSVLFSLIQLVSERAISCFWIEAETSFSMLIAKRLLLSGFYFILHFYLVYNTTLNHTIAPSYFFLLTSQMNLKATCRKTSEQKTVETKRSFSNLKIQGIQFSTPTTT